MWRRFRRSEGTGAAASETTIPTERDPVAAQESSPRAVSATAAEQGRPLGGGVAARRRRRRGWRAREAGAATVGAVGAGVLALARLVLTIAALIALLIAIAIVLVDVDANKANSIVKGLHEGANFFAGSFTGLIKFSGHPKRAITVDWGIALIAYLIVGALIASVIRSIGRGGVGFERRHRPIASH